MIFLVDHDGILDIPERKQIIESIARLPDIRTIVFSDSPKEFLVHANHFPTISGENISKWTKYGPARVCRDLKNLGLNPNPAEIQTEFSRWQQNESFSVLKPAGLFLPHQQPTYWVESDRDDISYRQIVSQYCQQTNTRLTLVPENVSNHGVELSRLYLHLTTLRDHHIGGQLTRRSLSRANLFYLHPGD